MKNPTNFPLYIYMGRGDDKDMQLAARFPNATWVPRIGERLVLPEGGGGEATRWLLVTVELVVHDLVGEVVNLFCKRVKTGAISRKESDWDKLLAELENSSNIDAELAQLEVSLAVNDKRKSLEDL